MIEPRIYRAAFLPAVLAVVLVMFSLESRPRPLGQGLPADVVFAGQGAVATTGAIVGAARDRRAGRPGDRRAARLVVNAFRSRGFTVEVDRFERGADDLVNVIGRRAGSSRRQIVVVAARDAAGVPDAAGSAADTAALMELARVFEGRPSNKTLVLASVDGSTLGEVGTERLAARLDSPELVDGVIVVSGLGEPGSERPAVIAWSGDTTSGGIGLQRTAAESIRQELGEVAPGASPVGQLARLAFPLGIGPQGVLIDRGYDAVRIAGAGELGGSGDTPLERVDPDRIGGLGRAALRTVTALDAAPAAERGPKTHITIVSQVMPGWAPSLLALALILPVLVAGIDAFARARRRGVPVTPWLVWVGAGGLAFTIGLGLARALALTGAIDDPPEAPVAPDLYPLDAGAVAGAGRGRPGHGGGLGRPVVPRRAPGGGSGGSFLARGCRGVHPRVGARGARALAGEPLRGALDDAGAAPVDPGDAGGPRPAAASPPRNGGWRPAAAGAARGLRARQPVAGSGLRRLVSDAARHGGPRELGRHARLGRARGRARVRGGDRPHRAPRERRSGRNGVRPRARFLCGTGLPRRH